MPNWCYTEITMVGSQENVNRLYNDVTELLARDRKGSSEDTWSFLNDSNWLGYVAEGLLGVFRDKISCRGTLERIDGPWKESGDKCRVDMMWCTAWSPCYELQKLLAQRYKLRLYFRAEEGGCGLYETNDACGEYFCRYRLDECEYSTYEEMVADCREEYGCEIRDFDHLRRIIEETGQSLQCYELVDDCGDKIEDMIQSIDWKAYKQDLTAAIKNEEIWAMGALSGSESDMHIDNIHALEEELDAVERGDYEAVMSMHSKEDFKDFLLKEAKP